MKQWKNSWLWLVLLAKRLYKKASFLAILSLIPVLVVGYGALTQGDSGVLTIALAQEGRQMLPSAVVQELQQGSPLIRYVTCENPDQAKDLVARGKADCAWIFPEDLVEKIAIFARTWSKRDAFVEVIQRQDNMTLMLAREKLSGVLFKYCAPSFYVNYIRQNVPELDHLSEEALLTYYDAVNVSGTLFRYDTVEGTAPSSQTYLTAPVRGLLGVVMVLCSLASAMYFIQDQERGTFAWLPEQRHPRLELLGQLLSVGSVAVAVWLSQVLAGSAAAFWLELPVTVLYVLCVSAFGMLLRRLCGSLRAMGVALPLLVVGMLVICPVFFDLGNLRLLQYFFPPTYYINAIYNVRYLWYMPLYTASCLGLYALVGKIRQ